MALGITLLVIGIVVTVSALVFSSKEWDRVCNTTLYLVNSDEARAEQEKKMRKFHRIQFLVTILAIPSSFTAFVGAVLIIRAL